LISFYSSVLKKKLPEENQQLAVLIWTK